MKKVKQCNNMIIKLDNAELVDFFGITKHNPNYGKYSVWSKDGICFENGLSLEQAIEYCKALK